MSIKTNDTNILSYKSIIKKIGVPKNVYLNTYNQVSHLIMENDYIIPIEPIGIYKGDINKRVFDFNNELGLKNLCSIKDDPSAWFTMYEIFLQEIYKNINVQKDDIVVDVGGHYGFFDLYCLNNGSHYYSSMLLTDRLLKFS